MRIRKEQDDEERWGEGGERTLSRAVSNGFNFSEGSRRIVSASLGFFRGPSRRQLALATHFCPSVDTAEIRLCWYGIVLA